MIFPASLSQSKLLGQRTRFPVMPVGGAAFVGALDDVPNLVHLYCIARRWLTSYEGRLVRLRRSSDQVEADFTYDADGNLDTAAIAAWAGGSAFITVIADQVGSDNVSQATAGSQPLFVASGQGGRAIGRYNGTSQFLQGAFTSGGALSQPFTTYATAKLDATAVNDNTYRYIVDSISAARMVLGVLRDTTPDVWWIYAGTILQSASATNANWNIWSALFNGVLSQFWHNGTSIVSGNAGVQNATGITIGRHATASDFFWKGDIATIAFADPSHDIADRETVQNALGDYYGIVI